MNEKDYTRKSWLAIPALIVVLLGISLIPPQTIGGVSLRRANIVADLLSFDDADDSTDSSPVLDDEEYHIDMDAVAEKIDADTMVREIETTFVWMLRDTSATVRKVRFAPDTVRLVPTLTPIEDFDTTGCGLLHSVFQKLAEQKSPVRIAFMGDSFVEGDILTADLREKLQTIYGGEGAGFAPMDSPLTAFRRTIKTQSKGWTSFNIMQRKVAPEFLRNNFYISGWVSKPSDGASTRWESTTTREHLANSNTARILFISAADSRVEVRVNDTQSREFDISGDPSVRQIEVFADSINSLSFKVLSGTDGFIGYGAIFEGDGVVVDNYSIRSNNGQAMFWTNPSVNAQINTMLGYDLIIMQYGLNIMQQGIRNYSNYSQQIEKMTAYVRQCFPTAAVLVMGVSDRMIKGENGIVEMDAVPHMLDYQRRAADNGAVAFWNTRDAMCAQGGMSQFVANGWAGKDFTHINYNGGRRVAYALVDAINDGVNICAEELRQIDSLKSEVIITPMHRERFDEQMRPSVAPITINSRAQ